MGRVLLGQTAQVPIPVTDGGSPPLPVDPDTITATIRNLLTGAQVGSTRSLAGGQITRLSLGQFRDLISTGAGKTVTAAGSYSITVETTNPAGMFPAWLDVVEAVPPLITLAEAKLQTGKTSNTDDAEIRFYVDAVNSRMEKECGAIIPRQTTQVVTADRRGRLHLKTAPVISILSGTANGVAVPVTGWSLDPDEGTVTLPTSAYVGPWGPSSLGGTYELVTVVGRSPVPAELPLAARMLFQDWWKTQRSSTTPGPIGADADPAAQYLAAVAAARGYVIPPNVAGLIAGYERGASFA